MAVEQRALAQQMDRLEKGGVFLAVDEVLEGKITGQKNIVRLDFTQIEDVLTNYRQISEIARAKGGQGYKTTLRCR